MSNAGPDLWIVSELDSGEEAESGTDSARFGPAAGVWRVGDWKIPLESVSELAELTKSLVSVLELLLDGACFGFGCAGLDLGAFGLGVSFGPVLVLELLELELIEDQTREDAKAQFGSDLHAATAGYHLFHTDRLEAPQGRRHTQDCEVLICGSNGSADSCCQDPGLASKRSSLLLENHLSMDATRVVMSCPAAVVEHHRRRDEVRTRLGKILGTRNPPETLVSMWGHRD
ncbi:hypothetical protein AK812_SmicGene24645 [Symbiodinium microadriaticum]|uniref:Uncharacterized protein n=1 Tax=Symbiodinium microadriaticum TaxID=2951 RepID=A0A1Q9DE59_SYMMI|nr:hypothetical protein AK812_SmicGene24645 [Symbiodinium microadriaticum]